MLKLESALTYLPDSLRTMLDCLFVEKGIHRNVAGISQAIIQAVRPRAVIAPLQMGFPIQMHHLYRLRFVVDVLNKIGFSSDSKRMPLIL